jgi:hypothetical protein
MFFIAMMCVSARQAGVDVPLSLINIVVVVVVVFKDRLVVVLYVSTLMCVVAALVPEREQ